MLRRPPRARYTREILKATEEKLLAEALRLPTTSRAAIASRLLRSLDEDEADEPAAVEADWTAELSRRRGELSTGALSGLTPEEAVRLIASDDPADDER